MEQNADSSRLNAISNWINFSGEKKEFDYNSLNSVDVGILNIENVVFEFLFTFLENSLKYVIRCQRAFKDPYINQCREFIATNNPNWTFFFSVWQRLESLECLTFVWTEIKPGKNVCPIESILMKSTNVDTFDVLCKNNVKRIDYILKKECNRIEKQCLDAWKYIVA